MANTKRKHSQVYDTSGNNNRQTQPGQTASDPNPNPEAETTASQPEASNEHNNETNGTGTAIATDETSGHTTETQSTASTGAEPANSTSNGTIPVKQTRKRRRKGEPEPDHTATVVEKAKRMKRVPQACDRCHIRRFKCDNGPNGCYKCLNQGFKCIVTDRNTGRPRVRGGGDGVVVNFDEVQIENEDLKARTREQSQRIDELQTENERLNGQLHYLQNNPFATNTPNYAPVSMSNGVYYNNWPMHPSYPALNHTQPFAPHYNSMNSNAFSGNMSIHYNPNMPNVPHGNIMPNAPAPLYSQWPQPNIQQGFPPPHHPHLTTQAYNPFYPQVPIPSRSVQRGTMPDQNSAHGQGMVYPGMRIPCFNPGSSQAGAPSHQLLMHRSLDPNAMNVPNQYIPNQAPQYQNHQNHHFQHTGLGPDTGTDPQNQNSQNLTGLGIHYPSPQARQGMNGIPNQHAHNFYNSQMIPSHHLGYRAQDINTQPQGMRPTSVSREGHYQGPSMSAYNPGTQYKNYQQQQQQNQHQHQHQHQHQQRNLTTQNQDHHSRSLLTQQQAPVLPSNLQDENTITTQEQELEEDQLSQSLELLEPTLESTSNNPNPEPMTNTDLLLPDTGPSSLPATDDVGGVDFQYDDGLFDIDTQVYNTLMQFGDGNTTTAQELDPLTNTTEGQLDASINQQNITGDNSQNQRQTQLEVEGHGQAQEQGNQDMNAPSYGLFSEEDLFGNSADGLF